MTNYLIQHILFTKLIRNQLYVLVIRRFHLHNNSYMFDSMCFYTHHIWNQWNPNRNIYIQYHP